MPVIIQIRADEKESGFYNIDIAQDDGQTMTLNIHEDVLVHDELRKGLSLSDGQLNRLRREAEGIRAYHAGLRYLSYRMRSVHEMKEYLGKKEFSPGQIAFALQQLRDEKLLDDQAFAESFIRTRIQLSTKGPQMIYRELLQAGVDQEIAAESDTLFPEDDQLDHARKYLTKQLASVKNKKSSVEAKQVLSRLLMQRGYSRKISDQVIGELESFLEENEKSALAYQGEKAMQKFKKFNGSEFTQKVKAYLYRKGFPADAIMSFIEERTTGNL
ncbi:RecX family transcriptional regulator [Sporolactobacillus pectinivorans]|uniref:RecX family transcriptional regulator n=1 Tax=Sporolactobacillus pectinivorans TaxID=1591408 RepID=UPI000C25DAF9|nr:RecX family transcriptional regulator [Sporolactobacillus pectinivorans]